MTAITRDSVLADILEQHCELIPIANRFGIFLGVGNRTINEICSQNGLSPDMIVTVFNLKIEKLDRLDIYDLQQAITHEKNKKKAIPLYLPDGKSKY